MRSLRQIVAKLRFILSVILVFAVARTIVGVAVIAVFHRDAVAWSYELSALLALGVLLCVGAALAVRRWAPPRSR